MSNTLINNLEFSEKQLSLNDRIHVKYFKRLLEFLDLSSLEVEVNVVEYQLSGVTVAGHPGLRLVLQATLPMYCQRCLKPIEATVNVAYAYVLSHEEPQELDDELDWLEISRAMDVQALIEDELLMTIPIAPTHQHDCLTHKLSSGDKVNPFAVLKEKFK